MGRLIFSTCVVIYNKAKACHLVPFNQNVQCLYNVHRQCMHTQKTVSGFSLHYIPARPCVIPVNADNAQDTLRRTALLGFGGCSCHPPEGRPRPPRLPRQNKTLLTDSTCSSLLSDFNSAVFGILENSDDAARR